MSHTQLTCQRISKICKENNKNEYSMPKIQPVATRQWMMVKKNIIYENSVKKSQPEVMKITYISNKDFKRLFKLFSQI